MSTYDVRVFSLSGRPDRNSWRVRWRVGPDSHEKSYVTKGLADNYRAKLLSALKNGEAFDEVTGLPVSWLRAQSRLTWYEHARDYIEEKWPRLAANSRRSSVEALTTVTVALVDDRRGRPDDDLVRQALYRWGLTPPAWSEPLGDDLGSALRWLERASVALVRLDDRDLVRRALNTCALRLDGRPAAATTVNRKRAVFYNALGFAVDRGLLSANPIDRVQWTAPEVADRIDRRVVANTDQVESIIARVPHASLTGGRLVAFYSCLYYAGMRPSEAAWLREADCELPEDGWGRVVLWETAPYVGRAWTDDGSVREVRGLKHRARQETRPVPIPPILVRRLKSHLDQYGTAPDGRLFRGVRGADLSDSVWDRTWKAARAEALTPVQVASPLARRPYDLRHAAVSLWLNAGVPAAEVARRVGHGVAVLLRVYANCIDGEETKINEKIEGALGSGVVRGRSVGQIGADDHSSLHRP